MMLLVACVLLASPGASFAAPKRSIAILYDDSTSMTSPISRWIGANLALQVTASLLAEGDELYVVKMNAQKTPQRIAIPADVDGFLASLHNERKPNGNTPYDGVGELVGRLQQSTASQKWLIVVTDGEFGNFSERLGREQFERIVKPLGIKIVFVLIEGRSSNEAARFWQGTGGAIIVDASKASEVPQRMEEVAALLTGRDARGLGVVRAGNEVKVSSKFPLRGLVVLAQGDVDATVQSAATGTRPMSMRVHRVRARMQATNIPRFGQVAHLLAQGGIAAGENVATVAFTSPVDRLRLQVYPEVAARMDVEVLGADGKPVRRDAQGVHGICDGESARLRVRLMGEDNQPLTVGRSDLATLDVGAQTIGGTARKLPLRSDQQAFEAEVPVSGETRLHAYARYPGYFNYQGEILTLKPVSCKRDIVVKLDSPLGEDGRWSAFVDRLDQASPLKFAVTIDGRAGTAAELKAWTIASQTGDAWDVKQQGQHFVLSPRTGCCAFTWSRPKAQAGTLTLTGWGTGNAADRVVWPTPVRYAFNLPPDNAGRLWWLYGCPFAALLGTFLVLWYLKRILFDKNRFAWNAAILVTRDRRAQEKRPLVRARHVLAHWFWPSLREHRLVEGYRFIAGGSANFVLVSGATLGEEDEIDLWNFDQAKQMRKQPQLDARLGHGRTIKRYSAGSRRKISVELLYTQTGGVVKST